MKIRIARKVFGIRRTKDAGSWTYRTDDGSTNIIRIAICTQQQPWISMVVLVAGTFRVGLYRADLSKVSTEGNES